MSSSSSIRTLFRRLTSTSTRSPPITTTTFLRRSHQSSLPSSPLRLITTTTTTTPSRQFTTTTTISRSAETSDRGFHISPPPRSFYNLSLHDILLLGISVPVIVGWLIYFYITIKIEFEEHYAGVNKNKGEDNLKSQLRELHQSLLFIKRDVEQQKLKIMQSKKQL